MCNSEIKQPQRQIPDNLLIKERSVEKPFTYLWGKNNKPELHKRVKGYYP